MVHHGSTRFMLGVPLLVGILMWVGGAVASAHVPTTDGTSMIRQDGAVIRYQLELDYDTLTEVVGHGKLPVTATDAEHEAFLEAAGAKVNAYITARLTVDIDDVPCGVEFGAMGIAKRQNFLYARMQLVYTCSSATGQVAVRYGVLGQSHKVGSDHTNVVDYVLAGTDGTDVFQGDHRELRVGARTTDAARPEGPADETGFFSSLGRFVALGMEHILFGLDHVLFLVLLLLGARGWRGVIRLATSFTVAHSVTLALAALGWVRVPGEIVEPLIALSIVYVAVENIWVRGREVATRSPAHTAALVPSTSPVALDNRPPVGETGIRTLVVFAFGLLHGLGFAGSISFTGDFGSGLLTALISFNLGIELGQSVIVLVIFPVLLLARRHAWSTRAQLAAAAVVGVVGLIWFVERLLLVPGGAG